MERSYFADLHGEDDPAYEVFRLALAAVFDRGDGTTEHIERLTPEARLVYLLWCFDGEIHNGGFDHLFTNSLGDYCKEILLELQLVGAVEAFVLLEQAISWFPQGSPSTDRKTRWKQHDTFSEDPNYDVAIDKLSEKFYEYNDNLASLINAYVNANPEAAIHA